MPLPNSGPMGGSPLDAPPPLPPTAQSAAANPNYASLAPKAPMPGAATPGGSQIMDKALQIAYEVEMALKTLAQAVPQLGPWVLRVVPELRQQLSQAVATGVSASPEPPGSAMPDGSQNLG